MVIMMGLLFPPPRPCVTANCPINILSKFLSPEQGDLEGGRNWLSQKKLECQTVRFRLFWAKYYACIIQWVLQTALQSQPYLPMLSGWVYEIGSVQPCATIKVQYSVSAGDGFSLLEILLVREPGTAADTRMHEPRLRHSPPGPGAGDITIGHHGLWTEHPG